MVTTHPSTFTGLQLLFRTLFSLPLWCCKNVCPLTQVFDHQIALFWLFFFFT